MAARRTRAFLLLLLSAAAPEPPGLWTGAMDADTPATLAGATVLPNAPAAEAWISIHNALPIDVSSAPVKPPNMAPTMPWLPAAHQDVPRSVWLPGGGRAVLTADRASAFLRAVAGHAAPAQAVLVYCHPKCWASWNAAKRLVMAGYGLVAWFPGGIEGWARAGLPLQRSEATRY
jgi:PQQ-dependent catabolism-associated CXXCW motif protein